MPPLGTSGEAGAGSQVEQVASANSSMRPAGAYSSFVQTMMARA